MVKFFCHRGAPSLERSGSRDDGIADLANSIKMTQRHLLEGASSCRTGVRAAGMTGWRRPTGLSRRRPNAPQGGTAQPCARRPDESDRGLAAQRLADHEDNNAVLQLQIAGVVDRLIATFGAQETLRLLRQLEQEAPNLTSEPFAAARPVYSNSFSGTGAADRRPLSSIAERFPELRNITIW
jgi:hypothetical protein